MPFCHDLSNAIGGAARCSLRQTDATLARIDQLRPKIDAFEQSFRQPTVIGYNLATPTGSEATLITAVAASLYAKDLDTFLARIQVLRGKVQFTPIVLQAIIGGGRETRGRAELFPRSERTDAKRVPSFRARCGSLPHRRERMTPEQREQRAKTWPRLARTLARHVYVLLLLWQPHAGRNVDGATPSELTATR